MKQIKYLFLLFVSLVTLSACETYGDYEVSYTPIHPLGGQFRITVYEGGQEVYRNYCYISNTTDNDTDKCWVRIGAYNLATEHEVVVDTLADGTLVKERQDINPWAINGKIACNVSALTFQGSSIENLAGNVASSTATFTVTDGKVTLGGAKAPSGTTADAISFTFTNSRFPNRTFQAEGYRYTGWGGD